jgi:hypothetical protein
MGPKPNNNLVWSILATLFCCLPFGIVSIVHATRVDNLWNMGDYAGAQQEAGKAKSWAVYSAVIGIVVSVLYIVFIVVLAANSSTSGQ